MSLPLPIGSKNDIWWFRLYDGVVIALIVYIGAFLGEIKFKKSYLITFKIYEILGLFFSFIASFFPSSSLSI